jgi:hypothetical protein
MNHSIDLHTAAVIELTTIKTFNQLKTLEIMRTSQTGEACRGYQ